jgi:CHAT domain-containing protein
MTSKQFVRFNPLLKFLSLVFATLLLTVTIGLGTVPGINQISQVQAAISEPDSISIQDPHQLVQQGRADYHNNQWESALAAWQQAEKAFAAQGDALNQAMVLSNIALTYQQLDQLPEAQQSIDTSLSLIRADSTNPSTAHQRILAQILNTQGHLYLAQGQSQQALDSWQSAHDLYSQLHEEEGIIQSLINLAQAQRTLGFYRRSHETLAQAKAYLDDQPDSLIKALGLFSLGNTLQPMGLLTDAQIALKDSLLIQLQLAGDVINPLTALKDGCRRDVIPESFTIDQTAIDSLQNSDISAIILSLANNARLLDCKYEAKKLYNQATSTAVTDLERMNAQINSLGFSIILQESSALEQASQLLTQINQLSIPNNRTGLYIRLNLAQNVIKLLEKQSTNSSELTSSLAHLLARVVEQARILSDQHSQAYALGYLGQLYEQQHRWTEASTLTQEALDLSTQLNALEMAYRWQWQLGRLYKTQGDISKAIIAYQSSVNSLTAIRQDLAIISADIEFSFKENIEPVYRELANLLLNTPQSKASAKSQSISANLEQARNVIEALQTAELDDFFRQACLEVNPVVASSVDPKTALIYAMVLDEQVKVIASLPNQGLQYYSADLLPGELNDVLKVLKTSLVEDPVKRSIFEKENILQRSQQLYNWLIRPIEQNLENSDVTTLTFVLDGALRNIPMSILYDGQRYLIEKYSVALSPGLQLLNPQPLPRQEMKALTAGISERVSRNFPPLIGVKLELDAIRAAIPNSKELFNSAFTQTALQRELDSSYYPIVHLATHGQFGSSAAETFLLAWKEDDQDDGLINVNELQAVLQPRDLTGQEAIELLVLSACQTADGDDRAALGIAGVAFRAGARSTVATLWPVSDKATAVLMNQFYQELTNPELTKAEALRRAQIALIAQSEGSEDFSHPFYWAPYILIGNWL